MPALESLLDRLIQGRVQFCIVGGFAAMAHGVTLLTQDLDICLPFSTENLFRLQNTLAGGKHNVNQDFSKRLWHGPEYSVRGDSTLSELIQILNAAHPG